MQIALKSISQKIGVYTPFCMITDMANSIMGHPSMTFAKQSADRNGDGVVNAADLVLMINGK
jgi:hypothetical protein